MTSLLQKFRGRFLVLPSLAAVLLTLGVIGATRADGHGRLTPGEMDRSRGGDQGNALAPGHCDVVGTNRSRVVACIDKKVRDTCSTCSGGPFETVDGSPGGFVAGAGQYPCGRTVFGICQTFINNRGRRVLRCSIPTTKPKHGQGCIPGPSKPLPQSMSY